MKHLTEDRLDQIVHRAQLAIHTHDHDRFYDELLEIVGDMVDLMVELRKVREEGRKAGTRILARDTYSQEETLVLRFLRGQGLERDFERWMEKQESARMS